MLPGFKSLISSRTAVLLQRERLRDFAARFRRDFASYNPDTIEYVDQAGQVVVVGQKNFEVLREPRLRTLRGLLPLPGVPRVPRLPHVGPVFSKPQVLIDGAFEGGGALGFAH